MHQNKYFLYVISELLITIFFSHKACTPSLPPKTSCWKLLCSLRVRNMVRILSTSYRKGENKICTLVQERRILNELCSLSAATQLLTSRKVFFSLFCPSKTMWVVYSGAYCMWDNMVKGKWPFLIAFLGVWMWVVSVKNIHSFICHISFTFHSPVVPNYGTNRGIVNA